MASARLVSLSFDSPPLLQVLPLSVHDLHVFAVIDKTTPGARQNAPLVVRTPWSIDNPSRNPGVLVKLVETGTILE